MAASVSIASDLLVAPPASRGFAAEIVAAELVALDYADLVAGKDLTPEIERGSFDAGRLIISLGLDSDGCRDRGDWFLLPVAKKHVSPKNLDTLVPLSLQPSPTMALGS